VIVTTFLVIDLILLNQECNAKCKKTNTKTPKPQNPKTPFISSAY
jgi:hypothetical protein